MLNWNEIEKRNAYTQPRVIQTPKTERKLPTAVQSRRGNFPETKPINVLTEAFDKNENYIDKAKEGNIGGAVANFIGTGLTGAQTLYLNAANSVDSLAQGKGLPRFQPQMSFTDYDKAVAERRGEVPTIEKATQVNPFWGEGYRLLGEIGTDPLELLPGGMVNDIKLAKGTAQNTDAYMRALQNGKLNPATLPRATAPAPQVIPKANMPVQASSVPVQPRNPEKGIEISKERAFAQNGGLREGKFKDLGADTYKGGTIQDMADQYGAIEKGMAPRREVRNGVEIQVPKETPYGEVSKVMRTFQESKIVKDDLAKLNEEAILEGSATKRTVANQTAVDNANSVMDKGIDEAYNDFKRVAYSGKQPTSEDIALGARLVQELQNMGQNENALDIELDMLEMLSESGRTLQAAQIIKKLSPEGRLMSVARVARKISKTIGGQKVTVSDETMNMIKNAKTEGEIIRANQRAAIEMWDQVPAKWTDKANSWRYTAMLLNPKTHARNIVGNALFIPARYLKNVIGSGLERGLIRSGERTKSVLNVFSKDDRELMNFARNDFKNEMKDVLKNSGGGKLDAVYRPSEATVYGRGNLGKARLDKRGIKSKIVSVGNMYLQLFKNSQFRAIPGETMELIRRLNIGALDTEDTWFMQWAYDGSFAQYMKANGLKPADMTDDVLQRAREYAGQEALKATYRDANAVAEAISKAQKTLAKGSDKNGVLNFGMKSAGVAIEGLLPFKKTPMNIVKRGIAYSPANLIRGVVNMTYGVKSGKVTATEAIDQFASGISGTVGLMGLGAWLSFTGLVTGKEGDWSDKLNQYQEMLGQQNYSMNIDGKSYTLDWAAPNSMPFFVGVEIARSFMEEGTNVSEVANILDAMTQISDPIINLSMLKGLNEIFTGNKEDISEIISTVATGYVGQYNPTLFGQIARSEDTIRRSTISTAETKFERTLEKFGRKQISKIPLASKNLEPYVDLWGREQKNGNIAENFLSPGYFKSENVTTVDKELQSLIGKLDKETAQKIVPTSTAYKYTVESNSIPYRMTEKESTAYQKTRGQESYNGLNKLFASVEYRKMNDDEKVRAIQDVYSAAGQKAKYEYFDSKGLPVTLALSKDYQEKYGTVKHLVSDKQFYAAVESINGKSKDIEKAYAIEMRLPKASDKLYSSLGISTESVSRARYLRQNGVTADQYMAALTKANTNKNANVSKAEAVAYLDPLNLDRQKKYALMKAMVPTLKDQNNPYY